MRERNMWISEPGREQGTTTPLPRDQDLGKTVLDAIGDSPAAPVDNEALLHATDTAPSAEHPLANTRLSLDELVPRTWKKW